jgi:hypothetical protein
MDVGDVTQLAEAASTAHIVIVRLEAVSHRRLSTRPPASTQESAGTIHTSRACVDAPTNSMSGG